MSFVFRPQELQLRHTVPSIFDGDLFSFLDEFEREPVDLTMPRLNSCVKNIGFKPIQPMDLSVNSSIAQIWSSVFGDCSQQVFSTAHTQEPQLLDTVPSLFDESNDLISFLDPFETVLAIEQQETKMDLTIPRLKKKVRKTIGFKVIKPLDLSVRNYNKFIGPVSTSHYYCVWKSGSVAGSSHVLRARHYPYTIIFETNFAVHIPRSFGKTVFLFTSHFDLTWDKGVELRFFQVGRPSSPRVSDAHQPQTMDAYILDFADGTRVADVYQKWLTWLDVWEMHRDDNVPWRMVGLQHLKRALENTCSARMKRLWPMGCHLTLGSSNLYKTSNQPFSRAWTVCHGPGDAAEIQRHLRWNLSLPCA
ncbi:hypothetical protein TNCV_4641961 [Trichonephila clavipes]|nr:hypothetical protein TNCV_4641961 [Trichonephila clavipes]